MGVFFIQKHYREISLSLRKKCSRRIFKRIENKRIKSLLKFIIVIVEYQSLFPELITLTGYGPRLPCAVCGLSYSI